MNLSKEDGLWLSEVWEKLQKKLSAECDRVGDRIPYVAINGEYKKDHSEGEELFWWTNGFWPGILWQMYQATGDGKYREAAESIEKKLDRALSEFTELHHDVGFMWLHSAAADYRLTGNEASLARTLHAANLLAGRYNPDGQFIRSWNGEERTGWVIIDCMMNVSLLYLASELTHDPRYKMIAMHHADTCLRTHLRPDGSVYHIVSFDPETGEVTGYPAPQGYAPESSWSRGQAWGLYGYALSYRHTGEARFLDAAKKIAHYFLSNVCTTGWTALVDFRAPKEPVLKDATAGVIAACGLLEIAKAVPEFEKPLYEEGAVKILRGTDEAFCNWDPDFDSIVQNGVGSYHNHDISFEAPLIYGDYFFLEGVLKLLDKDLFIW